MMRKSETKEPLVRIAKRSRISGTKTFLIKLAAIVVALIIDAVFIYAVTGLKPWEVYLTMVKGTFNFGANSKLFVLKMLTTFTDMALLLGIALALAPAFKMKFWNIGAEGQVLIGGLMTAIVMKNFGNTMPVWLLILTMFAASVIAGALWALIPAIFEAVWDTNETLFTLMMNYIAIQIVACFNNMWRGTKSSMGVINMNTRAGWFPQIFNCNSTINIIIIFVVMILMFFYLKSTKHGYEISVVGQSRNTARYAGINVTKVIIRTMILSGALCGLCGFMTVAGKDHTISVNSAGGYGFTAIIVAWMSKFNAFKMLFYAFLIVFLEHGAKEISTSYATMNDYATRIMTGVVLFALIGCEFFMNYRIIFRSSGKEAK